METMRIFVGTDASQRIATRVLAHSIRAHASGPVEVVPMEELDIPRPRDPANRPRTGFSMYRFAIPALCGHAGRALYVDADMQVFGDVAELWRLPFGRHRVLCTSQHEPPAAWRDNPFFRRGRQFSVMLLDCSRLDWDVAAIVRGLDDGAYTYPELMFDLALVPPDEIADTIPPEWNHLERYEPGRTKLLHYTVVPTQPWKNDLNPHAPVWQAAFDAALAAGEIPADELLAGVQAGHLKPSLLGHLRRDGDGRAPSWPRRLGRALTQPIGRLQRWLRAGS
jgi:hypothetical protein